MSIIDPVICVNAEVFPEELIPNYGSPYGVEKSFRIVAIADPKNLTTQEIEITGADASKKAEKLFQGVCDYVCCGLVDSQKPKRKKSTTPKDAPTSLWISDVRYREVWFEDGSRLVLIPYGMI